MTPPTAKEHLSLLKAAFDYGIKQELIEVNPWADVVKRFKLSPKQKPKPFTIDEIQKILQAFKNSRYYSYYTDYVEFLFGTGCRTAEAIGLCWKHVNDDCSTLWIGESLSRGKRKATKNNKARTITLTPHLQQILLARRTQKSQPDELVFTSKTGSAIDVMTITLETEPGLMFFGKLE
jgi:integrase